ncbi:N-acetyl-gamma-glutamyl-phosphate reductase [SAR202 cluster bacterium AD-493-K16_JPT_193m]|nr:N-acetyl-gamma-glutamyl-phosphate reductase [SAR202 cluster bacterium AD-493-K16_JPT_193m]
MKVGIINVTGYSGSELARLLSRHPEAEIVSVTGRSAAGKRVPDVMPYLWDVDLPITENIEVSVDVVFSALPSGASAIALSPFIKDEIKSIDIAADFRIRDAASFEKAYNVTHPVPELLDKAVYGMPEIHRSAIKSTKLVANPGCYPEASILALAPAMISNIVSSEIIIDAKSGISGAGRGGLSSNLMDLYAEANENVIAYGLDGHGHKPEIAQELAQLRNDKMARVTFIPHRIPMTRGILSTCYAPLKSPMTKGEVRDIYQDYYGNEPFVHVTNVPPQTKHTLGSNNCLVYPTIDEETERLVVVSCLDNLVKGAAGQAVQNMNLMFGLEETTGLKNPSLYP